MATIIFNHDIAALCRKTRRVAVGVQKSVSSSTSGMNAFDQERLRHNVASCRSFLAWAVAEPQLDLPESHPLEIQLPDPVRLESVESDSINVILDLCHVCELELINSQSARDAAGLKDFDAKRYAAVLDKLDSLLDKHIVPATPQDLPESVPSEPMSGPGARGVMPHQV